MGADTKVLGSKIWDTVEVMKNIQTETTTLEISAKVKQMGMASINGPMVSNTMANGSVECAKVKAYGKAQPWIICMLWIGARIGLKGSVLTLGRMEIATMASGKPAWNMERERISLLMGINMWVNMYLGSLKELVFILGVTELNMMVTSWMG
jgi:hypothetical protein